MKHSILYISKGIAYIEQIETYKHAVFNIIKQHCVIVTLFEDLPQESARF